MKPDRNALQAAIATLLNEQRLAILATVSQQSPYCNLVAFTPSDDLQTIVFTTPRSTRKYANMLGNPNVSLLVDDRMKNSFGFTSGMVVTAVGAVAPVGPQEEETLKGRHANRHVDLKDFIFSPECALVQVRVARYILVSSLRDAAVLETNA
jgi:nitroimidazol reductase NimA-like FMN-containing flavoprotein (pyridoxamine 5'-phosphate oxidase superfamily)